MNSQKESELKKTVFRTNQERGYTKIRNEFAIDPRISDETRGLITRLLSRPANWHFAIKEIISSGMSGQHKIYRMIKEAEKYGYIVPEKIRSEDGTFISHSYLVTDDPNLLNKTENLTASSTFGKSRSGSDPLSENHEVDGNDRNKIQEMVFFERNDIGQKPLRENPDMDKPDMENRYADKGYIVGQINDKNVPPSKMGKTLFELAPNEDNPQAKAYPDDFDAWWKIYPRKEGKGAAARAWKNLKSSEKQRALDGLRVHLGFLISKISDPKGNFCPHASTWLYGKRFDDDVNPIKSIRIPQRPDGVPDFVWHDELRTMAKNGKITLDEMRSYGVIS